MPKVISDKNRQGASVLEKLFLLQRQSNPTPGSEKSSREQIHPMLTKRAGTRTRSLYTLLWHCHSLNCLLFSSQIPLPYQVMTPKAQEVLLNIVLLPSVCRMPGEQKWVGAKLHCGIYNGCYGKRNSRHCEWCTRANYKKPRKKRKAEKKSRKKMFQVLGNYCIH